MTDDQQEVEWNVAKWHGKMLLDHDGENIGKPQDVYVDVETDVPQFATVKVGFIGRHLTFVPLGGVKVGPDALQVAVYKTQVEAAPNIELHGEELSQADEAHSWLATRPSARPTLAPPVQRAQLSWPLGAASGRGRVWARHAGSV